VIVANADFVGGFGLWVDDQRRLNHIYSFLGVDTHKQTSTEPLPTGDVTVKMLFAADDAKPGTGGIVTLYANDRLIGEAKIAHTAPVALST
jgi:arylsulfatase